MLRHVYTALLSLLALLMLAGMIVFFEQSKNPSINASKPRIELGPVFIEDGGLREPFKCEFDPPIKHVTLINHWYTDWAELNADYLLLAKPNDEEEVWGWSNCVWQPEDDWAACDIYAVIPEFVDASMAVDTYGHEALHGACRDFHD